MKSHVKLVKVVSHDVMEAKNQFDLFVNEYSSKHHSIDSIFVLNILIRSRLTLSKLWWKVQPNKSKEQKNYQYDLPFVGGACDMIVSYETGFDDK
ncbi:CLUMA_CG015634, isoform A [Clunio marinus]|uniref:CLUMA_CG015634, isoform A n=1 Tax=Clunio marinus TaxID=568069 RepID=A0A1J1IPW8_9DIPT|nr:CLUMA_CG015634, isoform A [Clunio marinus]